MNDYGPISVEKLDLHVASLKLRPSLARLNYSCNSQPKVFVEMLKLVTLSAGEAGQTVN